MAANGTTRGINHLRKALRAPEDFFDLNTTIRLYEGGENPEVETILIKRTDEEWVAVDANTGNVDEYEFTDVVRMIERSAKADVATSWKLMDL